MMTMGKKENHVKFPYEQAQYNGVAGGSGVSNANDDYRMTTIDGNERKLSHHDDANSSDMRMNYASSDDMNQNAASSDHGDKLNSGSEDEGERDFIQFFFKLLLILTKGYILFGLF